MSEYRFHGINLVFDPSFAGPELKTTFILNPRFLKWRYRRKWRGKVFCYRAPHPNFVMVKP